MARARTLAASIELPTWPNPRVGCVLLDPGGRFLAEGLHRGAGTDHAEVDALRQTSAARGGTAVVTLEPCDHHGRTGPCTRALVEAGIRRVIFAQPDPNPQAAGGAETLRRAGVDVVAGWEADRARAVNRAWTTAMINCRPYVRWKFGTTLDGRTAAADGTSRWITSAAARDDAQHLRSQADVIMVGTGTATTDDPRLTRRDDHGLTPPADQQPLRVAMGQRPLPDDARLLDRSAPSLLLRTRDPAEALERLFAAGRGHVLLEGGATLAAAFLRAGLIDEIVCYLAPVLLGSGAEAVADLGIRSIEHARRLDVTDVTTIGAGADRNVRITLTPKESSCSLD